MKDRSVPGKQENKKSKKLITAAIIALIGIVVCLVLITQIYPVLQLKQARKMAEAGDVYGAFELIGRITQTDRVAEAKYQWAMEALEAEDYYLAYSLLLQVGRVDLIENSRCDRAFQALDEGDLEAAGELLSQISTLSVINDRIYIRAMEEAQRGNYETALLLLQCFADSVDGFQDRITEIENVTISEAEVGDTVYFGSIEQNIRICGKESIQWRVLAREDNRILVISDKILVYMPFQIDGRPLSWDQCTLRAWLNNEFLNDAFTGEQQDRIPLVKVKAEANPEEPSVDKGSDTEDKVFILSISEAERYFETDQDRVCEDAQYSEKYFDEDNNSRYVVWVLRNNGKQPNWTTYVDNRIGTICNKGDRRLHSVLPGSLKDEYYGVRPVIWIELEP